MSAKTLLIMILVLIAVLAAVFVFRGREPEQAALTQTPAAAGTPEATPTPTAQVFVIIMTDAGFNPAETAVNQGDAVRFLNQSSRQIWPASAVHPIHEAYPGSGISKCGTAQAGSIFDACRGLNNGESFSFVFNQKGTWFYHDHLQPSVQGKIIVR